jgi:hypothetical protein
MAPDVLLHANRQLHNLEGQPMTIIPRASIESALAEGLLWAKMGSGSYWKLRRNGQTQTWKTRPNDFSIPVKAGLKACGRVDHNSAVNLCGSEGWRNASFIVAKDDPNTVKA